MTDPTRPPDTPKSPPASRTWEEIAADPTMTEGTRRYYRGLIEGAAYSARRERARGQIPGPPPDCVDVPFSDLDE